MVILEVAHAIANCKVCCIENDPVDDWQNEDVEYDFHLLNVLQMTQIEKLWYLPGVHSW